jgi:predicted enzyme related to lactoylglutathione lyase
MDFKMHAMLPASDLARAKAWYAAMFDLKPVEESDTGDAFYEIGGTRFGVYGSMFAGTNQATAAAIDVADFDAAVADLRGRGATFEDYDFGDDLKTVDGVFTAPDGSRFAWLKDSEGNILGLGSMS